MRLLQYGLTVSYGRKRLQNTAKDNHEYAPELSRHYLASAGLLEGAGLPGAAALQRPGGRRHDESGYGPTRPRSRALERGVRGAHYPSRRWPLRGEPESHANAPSAPGHSEAGPWRSAGALSQEPGSDR